MFQMEDCYLAKPGDKKLRNTHYKTDLWNTYVLYRITDSTGKMGKGFGLYPVYGMPTGCCKILKNSIEMRQWFERGKRGESLAKAMHLISSFAATCLFYQSYQVKSVTNQSFSELHDPGT